MAAGRPELRRGRIVWASVRDRNGIEKQRPVILLTATNDINVDDPIQAMAVTTTFTDPPPADHVPLPWHPEGRSLTKLRKRSAAVLTWIVEVWADDIISFHGDVPGRLLADILAKLDAAP